MQLQFKDVMRFLRHLVISMCIVALYVWLFMPAPTVHKYTHGIPNVFQTVRDGNRKLNVMSGDRLKIEFDYKHGSISDIQAVDQPNTQDDNNMVIGKDQCMLLQFKDTQEETVLPTFDWQQTGEWYEWSNANWRIFQKHTLEGYIIHTYIQIENLSGENKDLQCMKAILINEDHGDVSSYAQAFIGNNTQFKTKNLDHASLVKKAYHTEHQGWLGFMKGYWMISMLFDGTVECFCDNSIVHLLFKQTTNIKSGEIKQVHYKSYAGPKYSKELYELHKKTGFSLIESIDYGWFSWMKKLFRAFLEWLIQLCSRLDVAVVVLMVILRLMLLPLYLKAERVQKIRKMLEGKVKNLRAQYQSDKISEQKVQELYKTYGVDAMGAVIMTGVLQILIMYLFRVIGVLYDFRGASFFGLISDMSAVEITSWTNLFGLMPWSPIYVWWFDFGLWCFLACVAIYCSDDITYQSKEMMVGGILITILMYRNMAVLYCVFWFVHSLLGALQYIAFELFVRPYITMQKIK